MSLEITRGTSERKYRINPDEPCRIDWKPARRNARWREYATFATAEAASAALLELEKDATP